MIERSTSYEAGFSAVELLITLFIGVAFIASAYQLYAVVLDDSAEARKQSYASNVGYTLIRQYTPQASRQRSPTTPTQPPIPSDNELINTTIDVSFSCPFGVGTAITKVQVSVKYDSPQKEVVHALYVNPN